MAKSNALQVKKKTKAGAKLRLVDPSPTIESEDSRNLPQAPKTQKKSRADEMKDSQM